MRVSASKRLTSDHDVSGLRYRPDIDGLRAVAVLSVILYHAAVPGISGGFVGVDIFFVISGFVITALISREIGRNVFSLPDFYLRRLRRIFPALFSVIAFCAVTGWMLLVPKDYQSVGQSIAAATLFVPNMFFWKTAGYFGAQPNQVPLLHTWSLGVEEQFYLAFPLLLMALLRFFPRGRIQLILVLCVVSFGLDAWLVNAHPNAAFYLAPFRIWELLIGALLALGAVPPPSSQRWSTAGGLLGVALIGTAIIGFTNETVFPGFAALVPTLGAAAIIWAGTDRRGVTTRLLSTRPVVFVGLISYSLYLWHFPLLAFSTYVPTYGFSPEARAAVLAGIAILAVLSYRYIEQPMRQGRGVFARRGIVFGFALAALACFAALGLGLSAAGGVPGRVAPVGQRILDAANNFHPDRAQCLNLNAAPATGIAVCKMAEGKGAPQFALLGDSHAEAIRGAIDARAIAAGQSGVLIAENACPPLMGVSNPGQEQCARRNELRFQYVLSRPSIRVVILAARWGLWAEGSRFKHESGPHVSLLYPALPADGADNHAAFAAGLEQTIRALTAAGKQVWLVGPVPEVGYDVPRALYFKYLGAPIDVRPTYGEYLARQNYVLRQFRDMARKYPARLAWPHERLCDDGFCRVENGETPLYLDHSHLNMSGALFVSDAFKGLFQGAR